MSSAIVSVFSQMIFVTHFEYGDNSDIFPMIQMSNALMKMAGDSDQDDDNDPWSDTEDVFPLNPLEWLDSDLMELE